MIINEHQELALSKSSTESKINTESKLETGLHG